MPILRLNTPDTSESISRPVVMSVIKQLVQQYQLDKDIKIQYTGIYEANKQPNSSLGDDPNSGVEFQSDEQLFITSKEEPKEGAILSMATVRPKWPPYFLDDALRVSIKPVYEPTVVRLSIRYRAPDEVRAQQWIDRHRMRFSGGQQNQLFDLKYHYQIPSDAILTLCEIHRLRENVAPYNETLQQYLKKHFCDRVTTVSTMIGTESRLAVEEIQVNAIGAPEFTDQPPSKEKGDGGAWTVSFDYSFQYQKVIGSIMHYPCIIHNQILNERYLALPTYEAIKKEQAFSLLMNAVSGLYPRTEYFNGYTYPEYDDWAPRINNRRATVLSFLLQVDPADPYAVLSLKELGDYSIDPDILRYLGNNYTKLTDLVSTAVGVELYENNDMMSIDDYTVDAELNIRTVAPMDLRKVYHFRLTLELNLNHLPPMSLDSLREDGIAFCKILMAVDPTLEERGLLPRMLGKAPGYVRRLDCFEAIKGIRNPDTNSYPTGKNVSVFCNYIVIKGRA